MRILFFFFNLLYCVHNLYFSQFIFLVYRLFKYFRFLKLDRNSKLTMLVNWNIYYKI